MAQMCGATAIKYYLPTVFLALGLSKDLSLMASGIESTLKIGCTIMEMLIIDKLGRKKTLLLGCAVMSLAMIVSLSYYPFIPCLTDILSRSTALFPWPTQKTRTTFQITHASSSSSSSPSATPSVSGPTHGCMAPRYVPLHKPLTDPSYDPAPEPLQSLR